MSEGDESQLELCRRMVFLAAERTLSAWIRTALSLMALGFVIDRFGLILHYGLATAGQAPPTPHMLSIWSGSTLAGMGAVTAIAAGIYYGRFAVAYRRNGDIHVGRSMEYGAWFALILGCFGLALSAALICTLT